MNNYWGKAIIELQFSYKGLNALQCFNIGCGWRILKIFAFYPQGPGFDFRLCQDLDLCVTFFPLKLIQFFYLYEVGE